MRTPRWLRPEDPADAFPDPSLALREPNGLLAIGGDLSPGRLLAAYARGIFPWYEEGQPPLWWSPDPRAILRPSAFHVSRSLRRSLARSAFEVSLDQCFAEVVEACAATRAASGTWLIAEMRAAYGRLHRLGFAHSVEIWAQGELVGGVYGIALGRAFFGESMFSRRTDASKAALWWLTRHLREADVPLLDCQLPSAHLASLGSICLPRAQFLAELRRLLAGAESPARWLAPAARAPLDAPD